MEVLIRMMITLMMALPFIGGMCVGVFLGVIAVYLWRWEFK